MKHLPNVLPRHLSKQGLERLRALRAKRPPGMALAILTVCLIGAGLGSSVPNPASADTICTGGVYSSDTIAKNNFGNDCGQPFQETTAYSCTWVPGGWQCKGPGTPTGSTPSPTPTPSPTEPVVNGRTISWPDDGWYQVQDRDDGFRVICEGTRSCDVSPGYYKVTNHTKQQSWNLRVSDDAGTQPTDPSPTPTPGPTAEPTVDGQQISWPDDGWYQVQDINNNYRSICNGSRFCWVQPGYYKVTNHTKRQSWNIRVQADLRGPTVFEEVISWEANGYHTVRNTNTNRVVCSGGTSCRTDPGSYRVTNLNTNRTWTVTVEPQAFVTVDHLKQNGEIYTVFNNQYGSFIFSKRSDQVPSTMLRSANGQQTYNQTGKDTVWLNHNPQKYESPEAQTAGTGAVAFEYTLDDNGQLDELVSVVVNGERLTPEEWEEERKQRRDHFATNTPAGKPIGFLQKAYKVYEAIKDRFGGGGDDDDHPDPPEPNNPANNWGWGNHPQGEFGGTPTTPPGTTTGGGDSGGDSGGSDTGSTTGNTGGHPTGYDDGEDTGGTF